MSSRDVGEILINKDWQQGVLIPAAGYAYFAADASNTWKAEVIRPSQPLEQWIVVSQDCDIVSSAEPYVECMASYWSPAGSPPYDGARAENSSRYFFVRRCQHDGVNGAIVVDATMRAQVAKSSLLTLDPVSADADEATFQRGFRYWLGGRYSRPPLPDHVVMAIQRPIVDGIKKTEKQHPEIKQARELIREVRIMPLEDPPYDVEMIVLIREEVPHDDERLAAFRGWIETWLSEFPDLVQGVRITTLNASEMYVSEYESTLKLPLDQYSRGSSRFDARGPIKGLDHG